MTDNSRTKSRNTRLEDLASRAGVSISTVSRALNDSSVVNRRTKQTIWKLARELDYPFRENMPAGPIGADATISIIIPLPQARDAHVSDPFLSELIAALTEAARERSADVLISYKSPTSYDELAYAMSTSRANGAVFIGQSALHSAFNRLSETEQRFVVWGAELPEQDYCSIGTDNTKGGARATAHLARLGRQNIVFIGDTIAPESMQRYRGYLSALDSAGLTPPLDGPIPAHFEFESSKACIDRLIQSGLSFDGIVAASDVIALGAMSSLLRSGKRVPEDVSVVGYDGIPYGRFATPALSTIAQDTQKAGRMLISRLLDSAGSASRPERLPAELIIRESCGG